MNNYEETREKLLKRAKECLSNIPISFPTDGICTRCNEDLIDRFAWKLNQEEGIMITGCPNCHKSFCE